MLLGFIKAEDDPLSAGMGGHIMLQTNSFNDAVGCFARGSIVRYSRSCNQMTYFRIGSTTKLDQKSLREVGVSSAAALTPVTPGRAAPGLGF